MNFTEKVKQELGGVLPNPRHCRMAELGGVIAGAGIYNAGEHNLVISSENELVIKMAENCTHNCSNYKVCESLYYGANIADFAITSKLC